MKFLLLFGLFLTALPTQAQNVFWSFTDDQQPLTIAPECDARFEEIRGGVFMPSIEEVYQNGLAFLASSSDEIRRQAPYCFLSAALQGHADAQFQLAKMYNKGDLMAQDDLSSYKWALIAAANGNEEAQTFALNLEQVLTNRDLEIVNTEIKNSWDKTQDTRRKKLQELTQELKALEENKEQKGENSRMPTAPTPTGLSDIFTNEDRF